MRAPGLFFFQAEDGIRDDLVTGVQTCALPIFPARDYCDACMEPTDEWIEVGTRGRLDAFTILATHFPGLPDPPLVLAYVTLEGADTALLNFPHGVDLADIDAAAARLLRRPPAA